MDDPIEIFLQPECCADPDAGRLWCEDDAPVDCEDDKPWTRYVRADELDRLRRELAEAREVLGYVRAVLPGDIWADDVRRMIDAAMAEPAPSPPDR